MKKLKVIGVIRLIEYEDYLKGYVKKAKGG
jgi:hypothetical protein